MNAPPASLSEPRLTAWTQKLTGSLAAATVLLAFYFIMLASVRDKSLTIDEPGHAVSGYLYWKFGDYRADTENGNLPQRWIALPLLTGAFDFNPAAARQWEGADARFLGDEWLSRMGFDTSAMTFRARAIGALTAVALALIVWLWSRQLFGDLSGMISLLTCVLSPIVLANGPLMTSDVMCAFFFLLSLWRIWAVLEKITVLRVLGSVLAVGGMFLAKMSAVLLLPVTLLLVLFRLLDGRPLPLGRGKVLATRGRQAAAITAVSAVHVAGVMLLIWCAYGYRFSAFSPDIPGPRQFYEPWEWNLQQPVPNVVFNTLGLSDAQWVAAKKILADNKVEGAEWTYPALRAVVAIRREVLSPGQTAQLDSAIEHPTLPLVPQTIVWMRDHHILPEAFLHGAAHVWRLSKDPNNAFLNGEVRAEGWHIFFPYVFFVKTPLSFLALLGVAAWAILASRQTKAGTDAANAATGRPSLLYATLPLSIFFVVFWAVAISSHINIGHRHLLPIYPPLFIFCGAIALPRAADAAPAARNAFLRSRGLALAVSLLLLLAVEVFSRFPNYLAYFNGVITPARAYRHLVDSSLDWGQELPAIGRYLRMQPKQPTYLAYLGLDRPSYYGIAARLIGGHPGIDWKIAAPAPFHFVPNEELSKLPAFFREHPEYDSQLEFIANLDGRPGRIVVQSPAGLRLTGGLYVISATMLQPIYFRASFAWDAEHEKTYQQVREQMRPWFIEDHAVRTAAITAAPIDAWTKTFDAYYEFRYARLAAFLRKREPDAQINYSVLVYHLSDADVTQALEGPSP